MSEFFNRLLRFNHEEFCDELYTHCDPPSLTIFISLNGILFSLKYFFARRHQEQVVVLKRITFAIRLSFTSCWP